jgi:hypothetical protein
VSLRIKNHFHFLSNPASSCLHIIKLVWCWNCFCTFGVEFYIDISYCFALVWFVEILSCNLPSVLACFLHWVRFIWCYDFHIYIGYHYCVSLFPAQQKTLSSLSIQNQLLCMLKDNIYCCLLFLSTFQLFALTLLRTEVFWKKFRKCISPKKWWIKKLMVPSESAPLELSNEWSCQYVVTNFSFLGSFCVHRSLKS